MQLCRQTGFGGRVEVEERDDLSVGGVRLGERGGMAFTYMRQLQPQLQFEGIQLSAL